jgi:Sporulation factor SpoIIGA.
MGSILDVIKIYLDLPLIGSLMSWVQDSTLLWMVAQICGIKANFKRLLLGGAVGGFFQLIMLINRTSGGLLASWILSPWLFFIAIPVIMIGATFLPASRQKILRVVGYFYILSFLLAGIHWGFDSLNSRFFQLKISMFERFCFHVALIFVLGELGWGVIHRRVWERFCFYPIRIDWDERQLKLNALLDTGNCLQDPLTRLPVVIIEFNRIKNFLPKEVLNLTASLCREDVLEAGSSGNEVVSAAGWELPGNWMQRIRILPFHSLGRDGGILFGFRPDRITVWQEQREIVIRNVIVAFYDRPLSREGAFQALIPPAVLSG